MEFTEEEVRDKLKDLGYVNIPCDKLQEFMSDLHDLIEHDVSSSMMSSGQDTYDNSSMVSDDYSRDFLDDSYFRRSSLSQPLRERNYHTSSSSKSAFVKEKVPGRSFQVADDKENTTITSSQLSSTDASMNQSRVRRKVARKKDGQTRVFDETLTDSEAADITVIEERMRNLPFLHPPLPRSHSAQSHISIDSAAASQASLPAFIRTSNAHPHTKRVRKCDPVNRYHQFRSEWQNTKLPGESKHSSVRWQVREQMLSYESYEKPKHKPMVNNYVVPTDKKRQALRWQVRTALAKT